jgi:hypothetical protein
LTLQEFRNLVRREFGGDLRYMTPANARDFLDRVQTQVDAAPGQRVHLNETELTYEGIVRDFLGEALDMPADQAVIYLWVFCLELATASISEVEEEKFQRLFGRLTADGSGD